MATKKKGPPNGRRDLTTQTPIANETLPFRISRLGDIVEPNPQYRPELENYDRRKFNPTRSTAVPTATKRSNAAIKVAANAFNRAAEFNSFRRSLFVRLDPTYGRKLSHRLAFNVPKRLEMCIRRAVRTQVLHAKRHTGKVGQRKPRRNFWSKISC